MIHQREVSVQGNKTKTNKHLPTIIKWKGVNMIREESFLATINEIVNWAEEIDVTRIGIIGDMHSGKSTMAESIAHMIHKKSKVPWAIRKLTEYDLMNFEETLRTLSPTNYIMIFDDVSFLDATHNKKAIGIVKKAVTKIRHLEGGKDIKVVLIYNYHYPKGLDKYLREADFKYFTTVQEDNMEDIVGSKAMSLVKQFDQSRRLGITKKIFVSPVRLKNSKKFTYNFRQPFIPVLFYNKSSLRFIKFITIYHILQTVISSSN